MLGTKKKIAAFSIQQIKVLTDLRTKVKYQSIPFKQPFRALIPSCEELSLEGSNFEKEGLFGSYITTRTKSFDENEGKKCIKQ